MALRKTFVLLALLVQSAVCQLPPWDNQLFNFGWSPDDPSITRCQRINVGWGDRETANPASTPPYTLFALYGGNEPIVVGTSSTSSYNWTVQLPAGGPYIMSMRDANGYTGGCSPVLNVNEASSGSCDTTALTPNSFQLSSSGSFAQCSVATVTAEGGQGPYTMQVFVGTRPPKTTTWTTNTMSYTIDAGASEQFFFVVTDGAGNIAVEGIHTVRSGDTSCYNVATTVREGAVRTTLSYDPSSTATWATSSAPSSSSRVIQNTDTTTVTSVVTLQDGSRTTYAIPPGSTVTVPDDSRSTSTPDSNSNSKVLPAAIGGAIGGAALVLLCVLFFCLYQRRKQPGKGRKGGILSSPTIPFAATQIQPFPPSAVHDHAPLMSHAYPGNTPGSTHTTYFNGAPVTANHNGFNNPQPPWADHRTSHSTYTTQPGLYSPPNTGASQTFNQVQPASPQMTITTHRPSDLPAGAMMPGRSSSFGTSIGASSPSMQLQSIPPLPTSEKAEYRRPASPTPAPPPYSN